MGTEPVERFLHLVPEPGSSGVADHAAAFAELVRPHVAAYVPVPFRPPRTESAREMRRFRSHVRAVVADGDPRTTVLHAELGGGTASALWALDGIADVPGLRRTATVHDPPRPVWTPGLTRLVGRVPYGAPLLHRGPLGRAWLRLERRALRSTHLFALTASGAASIKELRLGLGVAQSRLVLLDAPDLPPLEGRPLAVGMFGHLYPGKGFDAAPRLRELLDPRVAIRLAGRGTEALPPTPGIEVLGPVEGPDEAAFFGSIRLLVLPYYRRPMGGRVPRPASGSQAHAAAHRTPSVALAWSTMIDLERDGGCRTAADLPTLAALINEVVDSPDALRAESDRLAAWVARTQAESVVDPYLEVWSRCPATP